MRRWGLLICYITLSQAIVLAQSTEEASVAPPPVDEAITIGLDTGIKASWNNGIYLESANGDFWLRPNGAIQYDSAFFQANDNVMFGTNGTGAFNDGVAIRRARIQISGGFWEVYSFSTQFDLANSSSTNGSPTQSTVFNTPGFLDIWFQVSKVPVVGNIRIGNQKEWIGLEHEDSFRSLEFLERSLVFDAFIPSPFSNGRAPGISFFDTHLDERLFFGIGFSKNTRNSYGFNSQDGAYAVTGRLSGLVVDENDGQRLLLLGIAASQRDLVDGTVRYRVRSSVRGSPSPLLPRLADTGNIAGDSQSIINIESAGVLGPLLVQAEYTAAMTSGASQRRMQADTLFYQGWYVQTSYLLTGETRRLLRDDFAFARVQPLSPFAWVAGMEPCGTGAWELAARYTSLDLNNQGINGGVVDNITLGVNWYLNSTAKFQWNYDYSYRRANGGASDGAIHALGMRVHFDF